MQENLNPDNSGEEELKYKLNPINIVAISWLIKMVYDFEKPEDLIPIGILSLMYLAFLLNQPNAEGNRKFLKYKTKKLLAKARRSFNKQ